MSSRLGPTAARRQLLELWQTGLEAVDPQRRVADFLRRQPPGFAIDWILAVGKAADGMLRGALKVLPGPRHGGIAVLPASLIPAQPDTTRNIRYLPGNHPVVGEASLAAGQAVAAAIASLPPEAGVLVLLSGGASALLELPVAGWSLAELRQLQTELLASGLDIRALNAVRGRLSQFKHGGLARCLGRRPGLGLLISDVPDDDVALIGSGPLAGNAAPSLPEALPISLPRPLPPPLSADTPSFPQHILARNSDFLAAAAALARDRGWAVPQAAGRLYGDALAVGRRLARSLRAGEPGVYCWGGETTVELPAAPGWGGRNQSLALAAAIELDGVAGISLLCAGTDGIDGNTEDAGALVDGGTVARLTEAGSDARRSLEQADAGTALAAAGEVLHTGPTGTNVMDVVIAIKQIEEAE